MWRLCIQVRLANVTDSAAHPGQDSVRESALEETLPTEFGKLDAWEATVQQQGFGLMRALFREGKLLQNHDPILARIQSTDQPIIGLETTDTDQQTLVITGL